MTTLPAAIPLSPTSPGRMAAQCSGSTRGQRANLGQAQPGSNTQHHEAPPLPKT